ncbi:inositol monophosphatase family protein [Desulfococcaceae bacterium HSG7]|nr:inositol monophosphatase family protein [Desulfococcaceae bacterium HSG7]
MIKSICDGLTEVARHGLEVLRAQTEVGRAVIRGKADTEIFDLNAQNAIFNRVQKVAHELAERRGISLELGVLGEEDFIQTKIGDRPHTRLDITVDPCDGSGNYKGYLQAPDKYRALLPAPDTGISIAAQLDPESNPRYVAGVATDVQTGTIYSACKMGDRYICRINDREVERRAFPLTDVERPKINLPFYSHKDVDLMKGLMVELQKTTGAKIYPGRCRASIVDLIRMLAGDCDAMADLRALRPDQGASLKPWDVCGMVPFLEGLGWYVCNEKGNPVAWKEYNAPVCFIASRSEQLRDRILEAVRNKVSVM